MTGIVNFRLLISVVNYCSAELVCSMLPTLLRQIDTDTDRIVIVDNQSPDSSVSVLKAFIKQNNYYEYVHLVESHKNGGFSYGNNLAIKTGKEIYHSDPEYVWLLNPDTLVQPKTLDALLTFMVSEPRAGIIGSRLESHDGTVQGSAFRFCSIWSELLSSLSIGILNKKFQSYLVTLPEMPDTSIECDWVAGASMFVRYKVFEEAGLMDETYFLYFEETDFCLQAKRAGWKCWYVPESRVVHYVGQSTGVVSGDVQRRRRPKYWFQSRQHYFKKNFGVIYTMLTDLAWGLGFSLLKLRYLIQGRKGTDPEYMLRDFWRNSIFLSWLDRI